MSRRIFLILCAFINRIISFHFFVETLLNKQRAFQDENMITQRLLGSKKGQSDMKDHSYRTIVTTDDSSTDDTSNSPLYPGMRGKNEDVSDEGDADSDDDSKRTPWLAFFTTPSSLTLLLGSWTNVSTFRVCFGVVPTYLTCNAYFYRVGLGF